MLEKKKRQVYLFRLELTGCLGMCVCNPALVHAHGNQHMQYAVYTNLEQPQRTTFPLNAWGSKFVSSITESWRGNHGKKETCPESSGCDSGRFVACPGPASANISLATVGCRCDDTLDHTELWAICGSC